MVRITIVLLFAAGAAPQQPGPKDEQKQSTESRPAASGASQRIELNLAGQTDTAAGESRRNENIQFNLVDNNALKELNVRLGTTATIVSEFAPEKGYFGAEFGNAPTAPPHLAAQHRTSIHGDAHWIHRNSVFSARSFFQAGDVQPARDNDFGAALATRRFTLDASRQTLRGSVNGNVLVPKADERTPLAADPAVRALIGRWLAGYPAELPNRPDVNPRSLNANAPQSIDTNSFTGRFDRPRGDRDRFSLLCGFLSQHVDAFQLVRGQNPDTDTGNHRARVTWARQWSPATLTELTAGFDRITSLLVPEPNAVGPMVSVSGLETLGPQGIIPIDRAQNLFRSAGQAAHGDFRAGFDLLRRQLNGRETDAHRGFFGFGSDFGHDAITDFRLGLPTQYIISIGDIDRGFRNWEMQFYAGGRRRLAPDLVLHYGLRYQPATTPVEVNHRNTIPYPCDCNNVAPQFGIAWRRGNWGVLRAAYGLHYGEIFPVTYQQVRFTPPGNYKIAVTAPPLLDPLQAGLANLYLLDPELATPFSHQYNASWEREIRGWHVQLGYVGSRSQRLLIMRYHNRAQPVPGIPQTTKTINDRRPDPLHAEHRFVTNGSRGYFDAARVSVVLPRWRGLTVDASYWFSKALDLGASYTNTAYDADSRLSRSQWEYENDHDMKGPSAFDQPHALLGRASYALRGWELSAVTLLKTGSPFTVVSGSDGPGYGNVDGNGGDRPNLLDRSILGRTIGDPDTSRARLPRSAFSYMAPADARGNLGRNTFRRGGIRNTNAAIARTFALRGDKRVTVRAESINLFNTPQFADPGVELSSGNFGQITNTLNDGRTIRLQLRFGW